MNFESLFQLGVDILKATISDKTRAILVQLGDAVQGINESGEAEWWQHVGFISKPPRPEAGKRAAQAVAIRGRGLDAVIASRDLRGLELAGQLDDGESCLYASGPDGTGQARILLKKDGGIHLYTRAGGTSDGGGMVVQLDAANDTIRLLNSDGHGIIIDGTGIRLTAKDSAITLGSDGTAKMIGKAQTQVDGASIVIGSVAVPVVSAALKGPTGLVAVPSTKTFIE